MSSMAAGSSLDGPAIPSRSVRCRCARPINIPASMCSIPSTSPRLSRSRRAAGSTTRASRCRTRSARSSTAMRPSTASIRSSEAPTRSRRELTAYAGYSEANRAPTPLELGCADPARPCIIAAFLVSDPPLKQVVSRTVEAGFRGTREMNVGTLEWKLGGFRATNTDDILAIPDPRCRDLAFSRTSARPAGRASRPKPSSTRHVPALCQLYLHRRPLPECIAGRLQQSLCRRERQRPDCARQPDPRHSPPSRQGRLRLFDHRRIQGWRRCVVCEQPVSGR